MRKRMRLIWRGLWSAAVLGVVLGAGFPAWGQNIFINEVHYDNRGTDADEGLEVAGPAGTDLKGWSLVLYNGKNGRPYRTVMLGNYIEKWHFLLDIRATLL